MKVVILGAGQVGFNIARYLATEQNDVTIVDQSAELLQRISDNIDVQPVVGYASHPGVLEKAGLADADLLIAVTASDEVNMVACEVGNSLFEVPKKIARIRSQDYLLSQYNNLFGSDHLSIDYIISPEVEVAKAISRSVRVSGAFHVIPIEQDEIRIVGVRCNRPSDIFNTPIRLLPSLLPKLEFTIACIERNEQMLIPDDEMTIQQNDDIYFIAKTEHVNEIMTGFGFSSTSTRQVLIAGGGSIGLTLASELSAFSQKMHVKVIEKDPERSEHVARLLSNQEVLCGDILDLEMLQEANIHETETFISVTADDKVNILSALLAKRMGAQRSMALLNNMDYASLVMSFGVDATISPNAITVSTILQHVRQGQIHAVHVLSHGKIEIIEAEPLESSAVVGLMVADINIKGKINVAGLIRGDQTLLPTPNTLIRVGDRLIIVVLKDSVPKVEKLFAARASYL